MLWRERAVVAGERAFAASGRRNARLKAPGSQRGGESAGVVAAVCDERRGRRQGVEHQASALMIAHLAFRQHDKRFANVDRWLVEILVRSIQSRIAPSFPCRCPLSCNVRD